METETIQAVSWWAPLLAGGAIALVSGVLGAALSRRAERRDRFTETLRVAYGDWFAAAYQATRQLELTDTRARVTDPPRAASDRERMVAIMGSLLEARARLLMLEADAKFAAKVNVISTCIAWFRWDDSLGPLPEKTPESLVRALFAASDAFVQDIQREHPRLKAR